MHNACTRMILPVVGALVSLVTSVALAEPSPPTDTVALRPGATIATITFVASDRSVSAPDELTALEALNGQIGAFPLYTVMGIAEMGTLLKTAGFTRTRDCVDEKCLAEAGRILSVDYTAAAWTGMMDTMPVISMALVDVQAGRVVRLARRDLPDGMRSVGVIAPALAADLMQSPKAPEVIDSFVRVTFVSDPPGAVMTLDDSIVDATPLTRDSMKAGLHHFSAGLKGYSKVSETVTILPGRENIVKFQLVPIANRLTVASTPSGATVHLNDSVAGTTPLASTTLRPGMYQLSVEMKGYLPFRQVVTVAENQPTSISCILASGMDPDSVSAARHRMYRFARRMALATGATVFSVVGFIYNSKVAEAAKSENQAYQAYSITELSQAEYTARWQEYQESGRETDRYARGRNTMYVLSILCCVGFGISIPF